MPDSLSHLEMPADAVASYLEQHPEFLAGYPELAQQLQLPREHEGAISLVAYQLQALRERNADLQRQLHELTSIAADNERLMERVHSLTLAVLDGNDLDHSLSRLMELLGDDFQVQQRQLRLLGEPAGLAAHDWLHRGLAATTSAATLNDLISSGQPWSGRLAPDRLLEWFGPAGAELRSVALLPLAREGVLALGSDNPDRFQPGMGTVFLKMIAQAVTAALQRGHAAE